MDIYAQEQPITAELWESGVQAKESKKYLKALELWETAVKEHGQADPRIGFAFIELVTEQKLKDFYESASDMYMRGLAGCTHEDKQVVKAEVERVKPIVERNLYKQWKRLLKDDPAAACEALVRFWETADPTVTTSYNERLMEHWERIAYTRANFRRGKSSVYEADERAPVYVKLGAPDYVRNGTFHFNSGLVRAWVQDGIDLHAVAGNPMAGSAHAGGEDTSSVTGMSRELAMKMRIRNVLAESILKKTRLLHRYPFYEIWVYRELVPDTRENVIYIFGEDGNTGEFGIQRSLEEMIPSSAFRRRLMDRTPLTPGFLLQMLFYEQTSIADKYFADAYNELESSLFSLNSFNHQTSFSIKSQKASQLRFLQHKAPQERSTHLQEIPQIDLKAYQYRMLDENNKPYLATFVESQPQKALLLDRLQSQTFSASDYRLRHHARLTGEDNIILDKKTKGSKIFHPESGNVDDMPKSAAYFRLSNPTEGVQQVFTVELQNIRSDSSKISKRTFPENIRALGIIEEGQPAPLSDSPEKLEASDILVGVDKGPEPPDVRGPTRFRVLHDRVIPSDKNMMIHFEVYNLVSDQPGPNRFEVEYQVRKRSRNVLKRIFGGGGDKVKLTLRFETQDSFYKEDLEIDTSSFEEGRYRLVLNIAEPTTGRSVQREIDFQIGKR